MKMYSTGCPKCNVLLKKLQAAGKEFELVEDEEEVMNVAAEYNIQSVPFIIKDGELYNFSDAIRALSDGRL